MPVVFAQRGMTTLGKSLNVSQLSADPWEKFLRCCQAGFASCSFFFFSAPNNSKGIILLNGERHSDPVRGSPTRGPFNSEVGPLLEAGFYRVRTLALLPRFPPSHAPTATSALHTRARGLSGLRGHSP